MLLIVFIAIGVSTIHNKLVTTKFCIMLMLIETILITTVKHSITDVDSKTSQ